MVSVFHQSYRQKVVYTFYFFEPQNIEQEMSNFEMIPSKYLARLHNARTELLKTVKKVVFGIRGI